MDKIEGIQATTISKPFPNIVKANDKPILVVGLPKSGTTSIHQYFKCGGLKASHWRCKTHDNLCGALIRKNVKHNRPPLENTGDYEVYAQLDGDCYFPQIYALEELHKSYPNATLILNLRNVKSWMHSMRTFKAAFTGILPRYNKVTLCDISEKHSTDAEMTGYYNAQTKRIRDFSAKYPSHALVEVQIDSPDAASVMEDAFGIERSCWGQANKEQNEVIDTQESYNSPTNPTLYILVCVILIFTRYALKKKWYRKHKNPFFGKQKITSSVCSNKVNL